jgi:hypothetical protein
MLTNTLISILERDIKRVINELNQYQQESNIWRVEKNISNAAGNLALHLIGNLNTYIGKELGNTDYVRNRPLEFSQKDIPRIILIERLSETVEVIKQALESFPEQDLTKTFPVQISGESTTIEFFLVHVCTHLNYHLGQINYHRRLIDHVA